MSCGIYKIENNINHKIYIGQSVNIERRWRDHRSAQDELPIHRAFYKYGIENFTFEIIEECSKEELDEKECYYIHYFNSYNNGYNLTVGGQGSSHSGISLSYEQVKEIRKLLSEEKLSNLEIAQNYNVSENTIIAINTGKAWYEEGISYPIKKVICFKEGVYSKIKKNNYCEICGKEITNSSNFCIECFHVVCRKIKNRPTKEELENIIKENNGNFSKVGELYGVTDNSIRKWCKNYGLPTHSKDYKTSIKTRKRIKKCSIQQIDMNTGEIIETFSSILEAERKTGIYHITEASDPNNTTRSQAGGYYWKRT